MTMNDNLPEYKIFAIRYATRDARRADHFVGGDPHDAPMPMDYFTWVVVGSDRAFLVDTGFTAEVAARRKREFLRCPIESLKLLGIDPDAVTDVVITHLHYDHVGNFHKLPNARFHLQEREMAFATGRHMRYPYFGHGFEVDDVVGMVRLNFKRRVELHDGEVRTGARAHAASGGRPYGGSSGRPRAHAARQRRARLGFEPLLRKHPEQPPVRGGVECRRHDRFVSQGRRLAASPRHIVPGHDPLVMRRYPAPSPSLKGVVVRLDVDPME